MSDQLFHWFLRSFHRSLIADKINEPLVERNWPDILRIAATMTAGIMPPSQILRKLASYPRQNELAVALREVGLIERTLFMIDWIMDTSMLRRARVGLNKAESHHALKQAINFYRRGEIRDHTTEDQHYRIAGLNLLAAVIIFWNILKLGEAVKDRSQTGLPIPPELLAHVSPLGWEHINQSVNTNGRSLWVSFRPLRKQPPISWLLPSE